ncbi:MAG TPA: T9SS type A sorting domain-containing protein [Flavipsychrobacter sp.]
MRKRNNLLSVAIIFIALCSAQLAYAQPCSSPINLISNGDFSSGFTGFTSGLPASTGNCQQDTYGIGTSFNTACTSFPSTPNGTTMMAVDFHNSVANTMILQQGISGVSAGTTYTVGFRGASRSGSFNVPINVFYDGNFIGSITINTPQSFGNYSFNWTAPGGVATSGNVTFRIATQHIWNDFALTDIEFSYCPSTSWRNIYQNDKDHNHFSVVELEQEDFIVAGTLYEQGNLTNTTFGVRRFDNTGNLIWQQEYFLNDAYDARCVDATLSGTKDEPTVALTGYIQIEESSPRQTYVMILDAGNGSLIDYQEFRIDNYEQSTGLDILYVAEQKSYYVAGYQANDILDVSGDKIGYVMSLDPALNINWVNYITSPTETFDRNMANNLTDLSGIGVFVTGSVNNSGGNISTLKVLLDYSGGVIWDLTSVSAYHDECGVDAVYNAEQDALFVLSNNPRVRTFELQRIDNASSAGASIAMAGSNNLPDVLDSDVEGFSLAFDPSSEHLIVAGMIHSMPEGTVNTPTFIAHVDVNDFSVQELNYIMSNNAGYRDHDYDMLQAFYGQQAIINYPDILGVFPSNFVILGYEGIGGYSLSVTRTDATGHTPSSKDCEVTVEAAPVEIKPERTETIIKEEFAKQQTLDAYYKELEYKKYVDCEPLGLKAANKPTGIAQTSSSSDGFIVFPNPASSTLQIGMPAFGKTMEVKVRLIDALGRVLIEQNNAYAPGAVAQFNVANIPEGVYFLSVQAGDHRLQKTVVIVH